MTNDNIIEIKARDKNWLIKGLLYLAGMLISLFIAMLPLISAFARANSGLFFTVGSILFIVFITLFCFLLYNECKPRTALKLSAHSFVDVTNIGEDIEIEWTNVAAVKMLGKSNMQFLGVTLENTDIIIEKMNKKKSAEIIENIEQNLPTILIPQSSVRIAIKDLKNVFVRFAREARVLESEAPKKPKNNPFTTDDVLRAFGQLPKEDNDSEKDVEESVPSPTLDTSITRPFEIPEDITVVNNDEIIETVEPDGTPEESISEPPTDTFYEALRSKTSAYEATDEEPVATIEEDYAQAAEETVIENEYEAAGQLDEADDVQINDTVSSESYDDVSDEEGNISQDIKDLLSQAKSSRITELEKLLTNDDVPYSIAREEKSTVSDSSIDIETINNEESNSSDNDDDSVDLSEDSTLEVRLESLIADAMVNDEPVNDDNILNHNLHSSNSHDTNTDTKEFIIDLSKAIDDKANSDE